MKFITRIRLWWWKIKREWKAEKYRNQEVTP